MLGDRALEFARSDTECVLKWIYIELTLL